MEILTRAGVPETDKWDLRHLFADVSKWQEDFAWLQREYPKLEQWKGRLGESAQTLAGLLEFEKALEQKMERVYHYASLQAAEDSTNNEYLARIGQVQNLLTRISEAAAFVVPEILAIDDERSEKFLADPALISHNGHNGSERPRPRTRSPCVLSVALCPSCEILP